MLKEMNGLRMLDATEVDSVSGGRGTIIVTAPKPTPGPGVDQAQLDSMAATSALLNFADTQSMFNEEDHGQDNIIVVGNSLHTPFHSWSHTGMGSTGDFLDWVENQRGHNFADNMDKNCVVEEVQGKIIVYNKQGNGTIYQIDYHGIMKPTFTALFDVRVTGISMTSSTAYGFSASNSGGSASVTLTSGLTVTFEIAR